MSAWTTILASAVTLATGTARAASITWSGALNTTFSTGSNWVGNVAPANANATDIAVFGTAVTANQPTNTASRSVGGLVFKSGTGGWVLSGANNIFLGTGTAGIDDSANTSGTTTISANLTVSLGAGWAVSTGAGGKLLLSGSVQGNNAARPINFNVGNGGLVEFSNTLALCTTGSGVTMTFAGAGNTLISGRVIDSLTTGTAANFAITNAGTTTLTGTSTYTGTTSIGGTSTLRIAGAGLLGSGTYAQTISTTAGGILEYASSAAQFFSGPITGGGILRVSGSGMLTLAGTNTYSGTTSVSNGGTLVFQRTAAKGSGTVYASATSTIALGVGGTGYYSATDVDNLFDSTLSGFSLDAGATVGIDTTAGDFTQSTALSAARGLTKLGGNTLTLTGPNTYTGTTTLAAGAVNLGVAESAGVSGPLGNSAASNPGSIVLTGGTLQYSSVNQNDYSGRFSTAANQRYNVDTNGQNVTWATALTSSGGTLTKSGSGGLSLTGANSYGGATTITGGTLQLGSAGTLGSGSYAGAISISSGATLDYASSAAQTLSGTISGAGSLRIAGTGAITVSGTNTFSGVMSVTSGTLVFGNVSAIGSSLVDINGGALASSGGARNITSGSFRFSQSFTVAPSGGDFTLTAPITLATGTVTITHAGGQAFNLYGGISDGGNGYGLIKTGAGVMRLGGVNTYTGDTKSVGGISVWTEFALQNSAIDTDGLGNFAFNQSANYVIGGLKGSANPAFSTASGTLATFSVNPGATVKNVLGGVLANVGTGTLGIIMIGSGTQVFTGINTYTGTTDIRAGTLQLGDNTPNGNLSPSSAITGSAGGTLAFKRTGNPTQGGGFASVISGGINVVQLGSGTLTLNGANTYTGTTRVSAGWLTLGASGAIPNQSSLVVDGGTLNLAGFDDTVAGVTITSGSIYGSGTLTAPTYALGGGTVASSLGSGTLNVTANSTLSGLSAATVVNLNAGTLTLGSSGRFMSSAVAVSGSSGASLVLGGNEAFGSLAGAANVNLGSALLTAGSDNMSTTYSGIVSGAGGFTKAGSGKLTFSEAQTYAGNTVIAGGTLALGSSASLLSDYIKAGNAANDGGTIDVTALGSGLSLASGQKLGGYGTVLGNVTIGSGAIIAPGGSIGTLTNLGTVTWAAGGRYVFEITNAGGTIPGTDWDLLNVSALSITASSGTGNQFIVDLQSLTLGTDQIAGAMAGGNWDPATSYQWKFLVASGTTFGSSNFDASWFDVQTTNFKNTMNGSFSVARGGEGGLGGTTQSNELFVVYVAIPEPGTLALAGIGLAVAGCMVAQRRRRVS